MFPYLSPSSRHSHVNVVSLPGSAFLILNGFSFCELVLVLKHIMNGDTLSHFFERKEKWVSLERQQSTHQGQETMISCFSFTTKGVKCSLWNSRWKQLIFYARSNKSWFNTICFYSHYSYMENKVYAGLSNGQLAVFKRDEESGCWITNDPLIVELSSTPVLNILPVNGKLWCAVCNHIKVFNVVSKEVEVRTLFVTFIPFPLAMTTVTHRKID